MKIRLSPYVSILFSIILPVSICPQARRENITDEPYSVTPSSPEIEELYLNLRNPEPTTESRLTRSLKWKICKKFMSASPPIWFNHASLRGYDISVHPSDIEHMLMQGHRRIFDELFERRTGLIRFPHQELYRYKNRSTPRKIFIGGNEYDENVFTCLVEENVRTTHDLDEQILKQYYISDSDYNMNELPNANYIAGRFVFSRNEQNQIVLHAIAEENSFGIPKEAAESLYLEKRNDGHAPMLEAEYDPLCKLNDSGRLRLCNSTLTSLRKYLPSANLYAGDSCTKISFYLHTLTRSSQLNSRLYYDEWMVSCTLTWEEMETNVTHWHEYYISRSYSNNEIFVFSTEQDLQRGTLSMVECRRKVSVVIDTPVRFKFDDVED